MNGYGMKALLLCPEFSLYSFWNYREACRFVGAKYPASPLGMSTMAALLPPQWQLRLMDLNTMILKDSDIDWADLVFIGGMLPQQNKFIRLIDRAHSRGKKVVVGGPGPTKVYTQAKKVSAGGSDLKSQPHIFDKADYLVLGEAECSIPAFLEDIKKDVQCGEYIADYKPDITQSPVPRFDLLKFKDYLMIGIQFSRGCTFNCEFCDIIEFYGKKPRIKTPQQIVSELDTLYNLGYRGHVDFVDDNLIGLKEKAKQMLLAVKDWSEKHNYPFFYSTEASINLADDDELLGLMQDLDFRYIFIGIESADQNVLNSANKKQNLNRKLIDDIYKLNRHGMVVNGSFIVGFDNESNGSASRIVEIIEKGNLCMSMINLLYALPDTQLTRRLEKENRLLGDFAEFSEPDISDIDLTIAGLNFSTKRPKSEIINDYIYILTEIYSTENYFNRCLNLGKVLRTHYRHKPSWKRKIKYAIAFLKMVMRLGLRPSTAYYYWRNIVVILFTRISSIETVINLMAMYVHFHRQSRFISDLMKKNLQDQIINPTETPQYAADRQVAGHLQEHL